MIEPTIPPPSAADHAIDLAEVYAGTLRGSPHDIRQAIIRLLAESRRTVAELERRVKLAEDRPTKEGRPMNRRVGRMVQLSDLVKELETLKEKWGDTCIYITGLAWGSVALWQESDIAELRKPLTPEPTT